jgi:hypothetical protein
VTKKHKMIRSICYNFKDVSGSLLGVKRINNKMLSTLRQEQAHNAREHKTTQGKTRQDKTRQDKTRQDKI